VAITAACGRFLAEVLRLRFLPEGHVMIPRVQAYDPRLP
jgi:hypothetical protein